MSEWNTYVLWDGGTRVKIGKAKNQYPDFTKRIKELQTGNGGKLLLVASSESDYETHLHRKFKIAREVGEWFDLGVCGKMLQHELARLGFRVEESWLSAALKNREALMSRKARRALEHDSSRRRYIGTDPETAKQMLRALDADDAYMETLCDLRELQEKIGDSWWYRLGRSLRLVEDLCPA